MVLLLPQTYDKESAGFVKVYTDAANVELQVSMSMYALVTGVYAYTTSGPAAKNTNLHCSVRRIRRLRLVFCIQSGFLQQMSQAILQV